jgi:ribosome-associated toxin RatA of RatAB toxin-antitoxin module
VPEFTARVIAESTPRQAFDFVADYRNVPRVLDGVTRWEPLSRQSRGVGARFEVEMRTFGVPLHNVLVLDVWEEPDRIGWRSESGLVEQRGRWTFMPMAGGTEIELRIAYAPPGGPLGSLVAGPAAGTVRRRLETALSRMRDLLAESAAPPHRRSQKRAP